MFIVTYGDNSTESSDQVKWRQVNHSDVDKLTLRVYPGTANETDYEIEKPGGWIGWVYYKEGMIAGLRNGNKPYDSGEAIGYTDGETEYISFYNYLTDELDNKQFPHGTHGVHN